MIKLTIVFLLFAFYGYSQSGSNITVIPPFDSAAVAQQIAASKTLKSKGYSILNGLTAGTTLTAAQQNAAIWVLLWDFNAINPSTLKIDSTLNYIH